MSGSYVIIYEIPGKGEKGYYLIKLFVWTRHVHLRLCLHLYLLHIFIYPKWNYSNKQLYFVYQKRVSNKPSKQCIIVMSDLRRIQQYLTRDVALMVVNALVGSKLDYCNSLFWSFSTVDLHFRRVSLKWSGEPLSIHTL